MNLWSKLRELVDKVRKQGRVAALRSDDELWTRLSDLFDAVRAEERTGLTLDDCEHVMRLSLPVRKAHSRTLLATRRLFGDPSLASALRNVGDRDPKDETKLRKHLKVVPRV